MYHGLVKANRVRSPDKGSMKNMPLNHHKGENYAQLYLEGIIAIDFIPCTHLVIFHILYNYMG